MNRFEGCFSFAVVAVGSLRCRQLSAVLWAYGGDVGCLPVCTNRFGW